MSYRGNILRSFRQAWGFSARSVEQQTRRLAELWQDAAYIVDSTYLTKLENGERLVHNMSMAKMVSITEVYSKGSNTLLRLCRPPRYLPFAGDPLCGPKQTQEVPEGRLAEVLAIVLELASRDDSVPKGTTISTIPELKLTGPVHPFMDRRRFVRAVVGRSDLCLYPLVPPGTLLIVDRELTRIPNDREYDNELERPIFVIETHDGFFCCWCDLTDDGNSVKVVQHPLGTIPHRSLLTPLRLGSQAEIVGEVVFEGIDRRKSGRP